MQPVLKFITTHLVALISGVAIVTFLALAVLGMTSDSVEKKLNEELARTKAGSIRSLLSNKVNEDVIAAEKRRGEQFTREFEQAREAVKAINRREPLTAQVFPRPTGPVAPLQFREAYVAATRELARKLSADTLPTEADIQEERQNVEDLRELEAEKQEEEKAEEAGAGGGGSGTVPPAPRVPTPRDEPSLTEEDPFAGGLTFGGGGGRRGRSGGRGGPAQPGMPQIPTGPKTEPKYDPLFRARVAKARNIRCYVDSQTFQISPIARDSAAPTPQEMWYAQVALWVQDDVIKAIAELNAQAGGDIERGDIPLEKSVVKRLVAVRVLGYQTQGRPITFKVAADVGAGPFRNVEMGRTFTGRTSNEEFDVVRFLVQAIVDERRVLEVVDAISRANFYQCVGLNYEAVNRDLEEAQMGYFYGTAPVVKLTLDFEGYLSREAYGELMPPEVLAELSGKPSGE
ncbi:MAG: hypothetical protein HRF50_06760 [Phycisphaerae bacterium]|jgi:hypothetical protein